MANVSVHSPVSPLIGSHNFPSHSRLSIVCSIWHIGFTPCTMIDLLCVRRHTRTRVRSLPTSHSDEGGLSIKADAPMSDEGKIETNSKWYAVFQRKEQKICERAVAAAADGNGDGGKTDKTTQ